MARFQTEALLRTPVNGVLVHTCATATSSQIVSGAKLSKELRGLVELQLVLVTTVPCALR